MTTEHVLLVSDNRNTDRNRRQVHKPLISRYPCTRLQPKNKSSYKTVNISNHYLLFVNQYPFAI